MKLVSIFTTGILSLFASSVLAGPVAIQESIHTINDYTELDSRDNNIPTLAEAKELIKTPTGFSAYVKKGQPAKDKSIFFTCLSKKECSTLGTWAKKEGLVVVANTWKNQNLQSKGQYKGITNDEWGQYLVALSHYYASVSEGKAYLVFPHSETVPSGRKTLSTSNTTTHSRRMHVTYHFHGQIFFEILKLQPSRKEGKSLKLSGWIRQRSLPMMLLMTGKPRQKSGGRRANHSPALLGFLVRPQRLQKSLWNRVRNLVIKKLNT